MDDVPPGPTGQGPRRQTLTVVIPVFNGGRDLERCLWGLQNAVGADFQTIVVDDGSSDDSAAIAKRFGAVVIQTGKSRGPALARNTGAKAAGGDIIFFLDADVEVHPDAFRRALDRFESDPGLAALFGSYDDEPRERGLVSAFRNLLHHFVHQQGAFVDNLRPARTFWTGCGAIRRPIFLKAGGFDPSLYAKPAIEDIELGYRLVAAGEKIVLARDVLGKHLKRWTLALMIRTDIFQRGVPWLVLMKREKVAETDLNVKPEQKLCVVAVGLAVIAAFASLFDPRWLGLVLSMTAVVVGLNRSFYRFLRAKRGLWFAVRSVPLHFVYYGCCASAVIIAESIWRLDWLGTRTGRSSRILNGPHLKSDRGRKSSGRRRSDKTAS